MATGTTIFSRVTIVAPRTRIDVALPADVAIADLMPLLLEMTRENSPDGGTRHGGWVLAKLGDVALDPSRTLASLGVVDGELLQFRRRSENPPPPLYDDVVDAIAESDSDSFRPWTTETAHRIGHIAGGLALIFASVTLFLSGPLYGGNALAAALTAGVGSILCVTAATVFAKYYNAGTTSVVIAAAGGLPMAFVAGFYLVPGISMRANILLGSSLVVVVASVVITIMGLGITTFIAAATAGLLSVGTFIAATTIAHPAAGIAAGTTAVSLGLISILPRTTIWLAKLPLPNVPGSAEELKEDSGFPDYAEIEQRTAVAHNYMTGLLIGCGVTTAIAAIVASTSPGVFGVILAIIATLALLLRARSYANGSQAIALLGSGLLAAAGILVTWLLREDPFDRILWVFGILILLAAAALVIGIVFSGRRFSPPMRRTVEIIEAICIASVLPIALAVMNLYSVLRHISFK